MPLYEFKCNKCSCTMEIIATIQDHSCYIGECQECKNGTMELQFPLTAPPILKGEGFYKPSPSGGKDDN